MSRAAQAPPVFIVIDLFAEFPPLLHVSPGRLEKQLEPERGDACGGAGGGIFLLCRAVRSDEPPCPRDRGDFLSEGLCAGIWGTYSCHWAVWFRSVTVGWFVCEPQGPLVCESCQ